MWGFSVFGAFIMITLLPLKATDVGFITFASKLGAIAGVTFMVHLGVSYVFGLNEARPVVQRLKKFILKPVKVQ